MIQITPLQPVDYLAVGHLSIDLTPEGPRVGGYSGLCCFDRPGAWIARRDRHLLGSRDITWATDQHTHSQLSRQCQYDLPKLTGSARSNSIYPKRR